MKSRLSLILVSCFLVGYVYGQRFSASVILGSNFAQIDGDDFAGFDKLGISAGLLTSYELKKNRKINIELLYNQTGSNSSLRLGSTPGVETIHLNYIDIPVLFRLYDWEIEDRYYKVYVEGGLKFGRLVSTKLESSFFEGFQDDFSKTSLGFELGAGYKFTKRLAFTGRYTRDINSLYKNEVILQRSLFGYFLTFRFEYKL